MSNLVVLPRIEVDNPFGAVIKTLSQNVIPFVATLTLNKEAIVQNSDHELTDFIPIIKQHAPDLLQDGKIDWTKVNDYLQSDDPLKRRVAEYLYNSRRVRENYANQPVLAKLQNLSFVATASNPDELNKIITAVNTQKKFENILKTANIPNEWKLYLLSNMKNFAGDPEQASMFVNMLEKILGGSNETGSSKEPMQPTFKKNLEKALDNSIQSPQFTSQPLNIQEIVSGGKAKSKSTKNKKTPPNIPPLSEVLGDNKQTTPNQAKPQSDIIQTFWRDGVKWGVRKRKDGKTEYVLLGEAPLVEQYATDPLTLLLSGSILRLLPKSGEMIGNVARKLFSRGGSKVAGKEAGKEAGKVAEEVASTQAKSEAQNVVRQRGNYDERRRQLAERIKEEMRKGKEAQKEGQIAKLIELVKKQWKKHLKKQTQRKKKKSSE
jgi:hypothetical protein